MSISFFLFLPLFDRTVSEMGGRGVGVDSGKAPKLGFELGMPGALPYHMSAH